MRERHQSDRKRVSVAAGVQVSFRIPFSSPPIPRLPLFAKPIRKRRDGFRHVGEKSDSDRQANIGSVVSTAQLAWFLRLRARCT